MSAIDGAGSRPIYPDASQVEETHAEPPGATDEAGRAGEAGAIDDSSAAAQASATQTAEATVDGTGFGTNELGATMGDMVAYQVNEPARLLNEAAVAPKDLASGVEQLAGPALAQAQDELAGLEQQVAAMASKMEGVAPKPRQEPVRETSKSGESKSTSSTSSASAPSETSSSAPASGSGGPAGAGRIASSSPQIQAQDEQGGASRTFTANVGGASAEQRVSDVAAAESLVTAIGDASRPYGERLTAALDLADKAIERLETEPDIILANQD